MTLARNMGINLPAKQTTVVFVYRVIHISQQIKLLCLMIGKNEPESNYSVRPHIDHLLAKVRTWYYVQSIKLLPIWLRV